MRACSSAPIPTPSCAWAPRTCSSRPVTCRSAATCTASTAWRSSRPNCRRGSRRGRACSSSTAATAASACGASSASDDGALQVRHAQRGCADERMDLAALCERLAPYFEPEAGGHMIDQAWQPRIAEGMVRAYLVEDRVAGFGVQAVNALHPGRADARATPVPRPRVARVPVAEAAARIAVDRAAAPACRRAARAAAAALGLRLHVRRTRGRAARALRAVRGQCQQRVAVSAVVRSGRWSRRRRRTWPT